MIEEMYLIILSVIVVILLIALIILSYKVFSLQNSLKEINKKENSEKTVKKAHETKKEEREEQTEQKNVQEKHPARPKPTIRSDINLTDGAHDINESMKRFAQKFILDSATLASMDGFSLASSHTDSEKEAANLTARYQEDAITEIGDTRIIPIRYQGEEILILVRTTTPMNPEQTNMMKRDGERILAKWL
jgi:Na+-transporting NADH:ubiquinone oxidoreductase subunit NqrC